MAEIIKDWSTLKKLIFLKASGAAGAAWRTVSGAIVSFTTRHVKPLRSVIVDLEPVQSGSGDPSPDNVQPISGRTGATVYRTGKNLWPQSLVQLGREFNQRTINVNFATPIPPGRYTLSYVYNGTSTGTGGKGIQFFNDATNVGNVNMQTGAVTISSPAKRAYFYMAQADYDNNLTVIFDNMQLELGTVSTDYAPYIGTTYPVSWETEAGTVYGGTLDVISGKLTVESVLWTKNTADMNNLNNVPGWKNAGIKDLIGSDVNAEFLNQIMNIGKYWSVNTNGSNDILFLRTARYNKTQDEWKALAIDVQIVVELATPQTYQLTPQQIQTLLDNVVWSDAGDVTVTYSE